MPRRFRPGDGLLSVYSPESFFWTLVILLSFPAVPYAVWKARRASSDERQRVAIFLGGLVLGSAPLLIQAFLEQVIPSYRAFMDQPDVRRLSGFVIYPLLLSTPLVTAYAVVVERVFDVTLAVRSAIKYALARYTLMVVSIAPFAGLVIHLYRYRDETVSGLLTGPTSMTLIILGVAALTVGRYREQLLDQVDRFFFRERYVSQDTLAGLVQRAHHARDPGHLASMIADEIDKALHVTGVTVLLVDAGTGSLVDPANAVPPMDTGSALAGLVGAGAEPLEINLDDPQSPLFRLPATDRHWLVDGGFRLLVPLLGSGGTWLGLAALGEKKSELAYSSKDRQLLQSVAASGALLLEARLSVSSTPAGSGTPSSESKLGDPGQGSEPGVAARECTRCHAIAALDAIGCGSCGGELVVSPVPALLRGKFQMQYRVGAGGMGVVYRAVDLDLGRPVAVKTLPRVSPERSFRLRREARAVAAVQHANLATIYGLETWRGTPMLVLEFVDGETLSARLKREPLDGRDGVQMGLTLSRVLERIHAAGVLHRDIKPSNIGFTRDGTLKLLDFGLARILATAGGPGDQSPSWATTVSDQHGTAAGSGSDTSLTQSYAVLGTVPYMCPEALAGGRPSVRFDLWSTAMVMYEAIAHVNPMKSEDRAATLARVARGVVPDLRDTAPSAAPALAQFLADALASDSSRRPASATEFRERLEQVARILDA